MKKVDFDTFYRILQPFAQYGLDRQAAQALIDKGPEHCDYFEKVVFHGFYTAYLKMQVPFKVFAALMLERWETGETIARNSRKGNLLAELRQM